MRVLISPTPLLILLAMVVITVLADGSSNSGSKFLAHLQTISATSWKKPIETANNRYRFNLKDNGRIIRNHLSLTQKRSTDHWSHHVTSVTGSGSRETLTVHQIMKQLIQERITPRLGEYSAMLILTVLNVFVFLTRKETAALDCFTCRNVTSIGDCTTVKQCGNNEHCHIAEYFEPGGLKVYDLDCQPVSSCYNQEVSDDTSHNMDVELWTSCCSTDYCNKKFSKDGQPLKGMSEPVMECYSCTDIADPADCLEKSACKSGEVCITTEHLDSVGTSHFKLGCVPKNFCLNLGYYLPFGKRYSKRFELCRGCCDSSNLCNNQFCSKKLGLTGEKPLGSSIAAHPVGQGGVTTSAAAATCRSQSLYSCYSCAVISDPADCRTQTTCKQGEVCYTTEHIGSDGKSHYQMGCLPRKVCLTLGYNLPQSKRYAKRFELCRACCEGSDLCNDKFCSNTRGLTGEKPLDSNSTPFPLCSNVAASTTSTTPGTTFDIFSTYNLVVKPQNNFASKGSTAVFQCEFDPPVSGKVTLTWYFEELSGAKHEVYSETKDPPTLQYVVNGVSDSDIGLYICEATFGEHKWSATGTLLV